MEKLIKVVNKLQDAFATVNMACPFDLPQIAVVGEQSSGKSSVLEKLVGRDFLPRGSGIVTRRPLVLQLVNRAGPEYGVFFHNKGRKYTNFDEIRKEIEHETDRVTGKNKNISPLPINLRIYSPHVLTLTLIDLPGVTNVAVGDQPADIGVQIREMVKQAISNPNCLILAVIPAVTDIANSEALKLSQEVDPNRMRTIGVVTKIDMMGEGTNCLDILRNKVYPLARGFVGVVNRSQRDIVQKKDMSTAKNEELNFFNAHPVYRCLGNRVGTDFLQKSLSEQLAVHIRNTLPRLKENIMEQLAVIKEKIKENPALYLDSDLTNSSPHKVVILLIQELVKYIDTQLGYDLENVDLDRLSCGSEISWTLLSRYCLEVEKIRPLPETLKREIYIAISNTSGIRRSIFSGGSAFLAVIKPHIQFIESPCMAVLNAVQEQFKQLLNQAAEKIFSPYPKLKSLMCSYLNEKLITFYNESKDFIKLLVKIQVDHINTNHPDFLAAQDPYQADDLYHHQKCYIPGSDSLIFREGTLLLTNINTLKSNKEYYCTLKGQTLYVYKDSFKKDMKEHFVLNDCKIKDLSHRNKFQLLITPKNERSLHKSSRSLELGSSTGAELEGWKAALVSCGIELDRSDEISTNDDELVIDSEMHKDIEYVYLLVDSYLRITIKSMQDLVSKVIVNSMILKMKKELFSDLVISVFKIPDIEDYMQESEELKSERQRICAMNKSCEEALEIIHTFQRGHRGNITKHRTLLPPKPKSMIDPSEPIRRGSDINISKLSHTLPLKSISDLNLNTSSISKSSSFQKNKTPPPTEIKKPKRPPPKMVASKFYDINPNNT